MVDTGRAIAFSQIPCNKGFSPREIEKVLSVLIPQISHIFSVSRPGMRLLLQGKYQSQASPQGAHLSHKRCQIVGDRTMIIGEEIRTIFRNLPTGFLAVYPIRKYGVIGYGIGERLKRWGIFSSTSMH